LHEVRHPLQGVVHEGLDVVLLDVDHGREALGRLAGHAEVQHLLVAPEAAASGPRQGLGGQCGAGPRRGQDFLRTAGDADRTAAGAIACVGFDDEAAHAVAREQRRERQAHGPAARDQDRNAVRQRLHWRHAISRWLRAQL
jgi:hypothetical protein